MFSNTIKIQLLVAMLIFTFEITSAVTPDEKANDLRACLGDDANKYTFTSNSDDLVLIERQDLKTISYSGDDAKLWLCLKERYGWTYGVGPIDEESDKMADDFSKSQTVDIYGNIQDRSNRLTKRATDFSAIGHQGGNCGGNKNWNFEINDSERCHKPKKKAYSVKMYNNLNTVAHFKLYPHHNCAAPIFRWDVGNRDNGCSMRDTYSFKAQK